MPVSVETYERVALEDPEGLWELVCGQLRRKPGMTLRHNTVHLYMRLAIEEQVSSDDFLVSTNAARLRLPDGSHYVPDIVVLPTGMLRGRFDEPGLEAHPDPTPFVVEVRSPSTGEYDQATKVPGYQARGDIEVWLVDLRDRTVVRFLRTADGSYEVTRLGRGKIRLTGLAGVTLDMDAIFRKVDF